MNKAIVEPLAHGAVPLRVVETPSGLAYWLVEDYSVPVVALEFAAPGGAAQDPPGKAGAVEILAGLLDEGAGPYDSRAFHEALDDYAIELGFHTERDVLGGRLRCLTRHLDRAQDLFALALNAPRLDDEPIVRVREQLSAKLRHELKDPSAMAGRAWRTRVFPGHPYGLATDGSLESVAAVTRADLLDLARRLLARAGLHIAVVGAISEASASALVDQAFASLPKANGCLPVPPAEFQGLGGVEAVDLDVPQTTIRFGRPGISRDDPDYLAAHVVLQVLGGVGLTSRLFREVREKRGLAYSVWADLRALDHASFVYGATTTKNERANESLAVIQSEIRDVADGGLKSEEIEKGKTFLIGSYPLRFDTSTKIAHQLVQIQNEGHGPDWLVERNRLIGQVTLDDAKRAAKRLFGDGSLSVAMVGRPSGKRGTDSGARPAP